MLKLRDYQRAAVDNSPRRVGPWLHTRAAAKASGAKHYFTGKPCLKGHVAPRLTSNSACMDCNNEKTGTYNKMRRQLDEEWRDAANARQRERRDPEKEKVQHAQWRERNREYVREYNRDYQRMIRSEDPTLNERTRVLIAANREDRKFREDELARERKRYSENPEKFKEKSARYARENPEVAATHARNRRARIKDADGEHTPDDIIKILFRQKFKCACCKADIKTEYHVDHITPITKGGSNWPANLQALCRNCNLQKSNLDPIDFANRKGMLL